MESEPDKFPIIDFLLNLCPEERIIGFSPENQQIIDVGKHEALEKAEEFLVARQKTNV